MSEVTICLTHFKSLALASLAAALYSVRHQDLSRVKEIIIVDNDTADSVVDIQAVVDALAFLVPVHVLSFKHRDSTKTHSWSTNVAVREATTPWVIFCRADYILDFTLVRRFVEVADAKAYDWSGFITSDFRHLHVDVGECELTEWRRLGATCLSRVSGIDEHYGVIDAGVWMTRRDVFNHVRGLDESLTAWGHAQTHFQYKLHAAGIEFVRIPEVLFYHPRHAAPRDIDLAHQQLRDQQIDVRELWARYEGARPY